MQHYACAILFEAGRILLGRRAPHRRAYPGKWDVIGGRVEDGETVEAALHRELGEELAIVPLAWEHLCTIRDTAPQARGDAAYHLFLVRAWTGDGPRMANAEHSALAWFAIDEACALPDLALGEYRAVFGSIVSGRIVFDSIGRSGLACPPATT